MRNHFVLERKNFRPQYPGDFLILLDLCLMTWRISFKYYSRRDIIPRHVDALALCYVFFFFANTSDQIPFSQNYDPVSYTPLMLCVFNFIQFKVDYKRRIFKRLLMAIFIYSSSFARNFLRGKRCARNTLLLRFVGDFWPRVKPWHDV